MVRSSSSIPDRNTGAGLSTVAVEIVHLTAENDLGVFTISMLQDALFGALRVSMEDQAPLLSDDEDQPNFWLEGLMTIKYRLTGSDEVVSLASRHPVLQVGRATSWPPYNTVMQDVSGPNEYFRTDDPRREPAFLLWSGSITITNRPSPFLEADIVIDSFEYLGGTAGQTTGVTLHWTDQRAAVPLIDHYHVLRKQYDLHGSGEWQRLGGCINQPAAVTDHTFDGSNSVTYKVRQVFVDPLGDEVHGCGRETDYTVPAFPQNHGQLQEAGFWR